MHTQTKTPLFRGALVLKSRLEREADSELQLPRVLGRLHLTEIRIQIEAVQRDHADRVVVVRTVEQIENFSAEREFFTFAPYLEALLDRHIKTHIRRPRIGVTPAGTRASAADRALIEIHTGRVSAGSC